MLNLFPPLSFDEKQENRGHPSNRRHALSKIINLTYSNPVYMSERKLKPLIGVSSKLTDGRVHSWMAQAIRSCQPSRCEKVTLLFFC
jgi:hypothetical protein